MTAQQKTGVVGEAEFFNVGTMMAGLAALGVVVATMFATGIVVRVLGASMAALGPMLIVSSWRIRVWERYRNLYPREGFEYDTITYSRARATCFLQSLTLIFGPVAYIAIALYFNV